MESAPLNYSVTNALIYPIYNTFTIPKNEKDQGILNSALIGGIGQLLITLPLSSLLLIESVVRLALALIIGLPMLAYELCSISFTETTCSLLWTSALANLALFLQTFSSPKENFLILLESLATYPMFEDKDD